MLERCWLILAGLRGMKAAQVWLVWAPPASHGRQPVTIPGPGDLPTHHTVAALLFVTGASHKLSSAANVLVRSAQQQRGGSEQQMR